VAGQLKFNVVQTAQETPSQNRTVHKRMMTENRPHLKSNWGKREVTKRCKKVTQCSGRMIAIQKLYTRELYITVTL
jgi:hypothetical protein